MVFLLSADKFLAAERVKPPQFPGFLSAPGVLLRLKWASLGLSTLFRETIPALDNGTITKAFT
jgi:hypothetical protein